MLASAVYMRSFLIVPHITKSIMAVRRVKMRPPMIESDSLASVLAPPERYEAPVHPKNAIARPTICSQSGNWSGFFT
jgi:hypothetical protein